MLSGIQKYKKLIQNFRDLDLLKSCDISIKINSEITFKIKDQDFVAAVNEYFKE